MVLNLSEQIKTVREPRQQLIDIVQVHFDFDVSKRITLRADINQFKFLEDTSVWKQARGVINKMFEVYWDEVWICDFNEGMTKAQVEMAFFKGFTECYEEGTVSLTEKGFEEPETDKLLEKIRKTTKVKAQTPEEKIAKQAMVEVLSEKKKKLDKKRKELDNKL